MVAFRVIDKRGIEAIFFTREEFQLLQQWLKENISCITCFQRSIEKGWTEREIEMVNKLFSKNFKI